MKGYPVPDTSYIGLTLRNITFSGLTQNPHYVLENVDYIDASEVYVQLWQQWNVTADEGTPTDPPTDSPDGGHALGSPTLLLLIVLTFSTMLYSTY